MSQARRERRQRGREAEVKLYKLLQTKYPKAIIIKLHDDRQYPSWGDILIISQTHDILIECKSTVRDVIEQASLRPNQRDMLEQFDNLRKDTIAFLALYYYKYDDFIMMSYNRIIDLPSRIEYTVALQHGQSI